MLSPIFQVRHFDVKELYPFRVNIAFEKEDGPVTNVLFGAQVKDGVSTPQFLPSIKNVAFMKTDPFAVKVVYDEECDIGGVRTTMLFVHACCPWRAWIHGEGLDPVSPPVAYVLVVGSSYSIATRMHPELVCWVPQT